MIILFIKEAHKSEKNNYKTVKLYKEALQRVKMLIDSEVQSNQRMSVLTTKFVFIIDQVIQSFILTFFDSKIVFNL